MIRHVFLFFSLLVSNARYIREQIRCWMQLQLTINVRGV